MRTTVTLDDDLVEKLKELAQRRRVAFKRIVNDVLRRGLSAPDLREAKPKPFKAETFSSDFKPGVDLLKLNPMLDELDAESLRGGRRP
jgi:hypothetical protein